MAVTEAAICSRHKECTETVCGTTPRQYSLCGGAYTDPIKWRRNIPTVILNAVIADLVRDWLYHTSVPGMEMEAVTAAFAAEFSTIAVEFTFDAFYRHEPSASWHTRGIIFPERPLSSLSLYLPDDWCDLKNEHGHVNVRDASGELWQSARLEPLQSVAGDVQAYLGTQRIVGFAFYPVMLERGILRWLFVSEREGGYTVCAMHCSADEVLVVNGHAFDLETLRDQLSSAINTDPWKR